MKKVKKTKKHIFKKLQKGVVVSIVKEPTGVISVVGTSTMLVGDTGAIIRIDLDDSEISKTVSDYILSGKQVGIGIYPLQDPNDEDEGDSEDD